MSGFPSLFRRSLCVLSLVGSLAIAAHGSEFNVANLLLTVESGPAITADINHDGVPDIVMLSGTAGGGPEFVTLLGKRGGGFGTPIISPATNLGDFPIYTAGDIDGDGQIDIAALTKLGDLEVFMGRADGTFHFWSISPYKSIGTSCVLGDFNGDGKTDLACAWSSPKNNRFAVRLNMLLGNGDGTFQPPIHTTIYKQRAGPSIAAGDLDGDGKLDLVVTLGGEVTVLLGKGDGTFRRTAYPVSGAFFDVVLGDLNNDGHLDLLASDQEGIGQFYVQLGNGDGTFRAQATYPIVSGDNTLALGDFDGDGFMDVAVNNDLDTETVYLNNGDGTLGSRTDYPVVGNAFLKQQVVADFNGDGLMDIVVPNQEGENQGMLGVLTNTGSGTGVK